MVKKKHNIKGVIIAGGEGTRLRPLTYVVNKQLLPVYNKPLIYYPILSLKRSGIDDIIIVSHRHALGQFVDILGDGSELGVSISYTVQEKPLGLAHALKQAEHAAEGSRIALILGDNIFEDTFTEAVEAMRVKDSGSTIVLKKTSDTDLLKRSGVAVVQNGKVVKIDEKPENPESDLLSVGMYLYDERVFGLIDKVKPSPRGEYEITDLNNLYIQEGGMDSSIIEGEWIDAGTFDSLLYASNYIAKHKDDWKINHESRNT